MSDLENVNDICDKCLTGIRKFIGFSTASVGPGLFDARSEIKDRLNALQGPQSSKSEEELRNQYMDRNQNNSDYKNETDLDNIIIKQTLDSEEPLTGPKLDLFLTAVLASPHANIKLQGEAQTHWRNFKFIITKIKNETHLEAKLNQAFNYTQDKNNCVLTKWSNKLKEKLDKMPSSDTEDYSDSSRNSTPRC